MGGGATSRARPSPLASSALPAAAWNIAHMVRFSECDPAGIVFTPRFVNIMNGVIEDFFTQRLGQNYHDLIRSGLGLGYASVQCDFFKPALMGDNLVFTPLLGRIGRASAEILVHGHRDGAEIVRGQFVMVTTDLSKHAAVSIPAALRAALVSYQDDCR